MKPRLVISTGAGISAESGVRTFRDADGLWEEYPVMQVCSADGFRRDPALVHHFYNERRRQLLTVKPNAAHLGLVELEKDFDVQIITQNVDDLHERAGSSKILHLHGELMKARDINDYYLTFPLTADNYETTPDTVIEGHHVRPHIVFFQEAVPNFETATEMVSQADIFVIIGTSLAVYPAASLLNYTRRGIPIFYIDPTPAAVPDGVQVICAKATDGVAKLAEILKNFV
jgi:NAD-dependent deacetylase